MKKMQFNTLITRPPHAPLVPGPTRRSLSLLPRCQVPPFPSNALLAWTLKNSRSRIMTACISPVEELIISQSEISGENDDATVPFSESVMEVEEEKSGSEERHRIWNQMKEIVKFTGPATALWICGPLMSLIDTAVIGQGSSIELAALGPGTVVCDYMSYVFMFLSIATSNIVATSLARKDKNEVQRQISNLLLVAFTCGCLMLLFTKFFGTWALKAFTGPKNAHVVPAANTYVQIRGLAWPALLVGWVAQSASLGMKDSWGPLKALAVASAVNIFGHVVLCSFFGYGIAGAAWATAVSQVIAGYMMIEALNKKGYNAFSFSIPSRHELLSVFGLAAPVFIIKISKVAFYSLLTYFATAMGTHNMAAHQVMVQTYCMCTVWGEPLSQTAQSFMPESLYGVHRNLEKARMLLKSLVIIGVTIGLLVGVVGTSVPLLFPKIFTHDQNIIQEMHKVLVPFFLALAITPPTQSLEGTLLAGRDLKFVTLSMSGCFSAGALLLLLVSSRGYGLPGIWFGLVGFQWARFFLSLRRVRSPNGVLYSQDSSPYNLEKLKAA